MELDIDIYTKNGKLVEIHYIEGRKEFYILLDESEPRLFKLGTKEIRKGKLDEELLQNIIEQAEQKFKKIRLDALFNPDEQPEPPVLSFFERMVKPEDVETLKELLKKEFLNQEDHISTISNFMTNGSHGMDVIMSVKESYCFENSWEVTIHVPYRSTWTNRRFASFVDRDTKPVGKINFRFDRLEHKGIGEICVREIY